jgi:predicted anti-sigma-YlaC factor YlaD
MLKCRDVSELASDYLDRTLPASVRLRTWLHLRACRMCRTYLDQLRKTTRLLRRGTLAPPDAAMEASLVAAARRPPDEAG